MMKSALPALRPLFFAMAAALLSACAAQPLQQPGAPVAVQPTQPSTTDRSSGSAAAASRQTIEAMAPARTDPDENEVLLCADAVRVRAPNALRIVSTEGRLPSDPVWKQSQAAREDWQGMLCLALAARMTGDSGYITALDRYLLAWSSVFEPQGNPISENTFERVALAYRLARRDLSPAALAGTTRMLRSMAAVLLDPTRVRAGTRQNNWQSHRIKLLTAVAFALDDRQFMEISRMAFRRQIAANIAADGLVLDFLERDALHYVVYSLEPLLMSAWIMRQAGEDWYRYVAGNGASLSQALGWLAPYARGERSHEEFRHSKIELDQRRAAAGVPGFSGLWQPERALTCYHLAAGLDPRWQPLADHLGRAPGLIKVLARY